MPNKKDYSYRYDLDKRTSEQAYENMLQEFMVELMDDCNIPHNHPQAKILFTSAIKLATSYCAGDVANAYMYIAEHLFDVDLYNDAMKWREFVEIFEDVQMGELQYAYELNVLMEGLS